MLGWKYRNWLEALSEANFVTGKDILEGNISLDTCNFFLYHDMDSAGIEEHLYPTLKIEEALGIRSTTYLLVDDRVNTKQGEYFTYFPRESYYKRNLKELLKLQDSGFEFGYHVNATGRCKRLGDTVDPKEAYRIFLQDIKWFKEQGFDIRTMSAHGFKWFDNVRSDYDNYQLEYDATERGCPAVSQYHLSKKFLEAGGRRIEDLKDVTFGKTIWKKWHTIKVEDCNDIKPIEKFMTEVVSAFKE